MYDQLRGERINADVPVSEVDPDSLDRPGRHRLRDDTPAAAAVCGPPPGPRGERAKDWSEFGTGGIDRPSKHRLPDHAAAAAAVCGPSLGPGTDRAEGWPWLGTGEPGRADLANATQAASCLAGRHCRGHTPAVDQRPGSDHREVLEPALRALLPPPVHARDSQQPGAVGADRYATAGPGESVTASEPAEPDHDSQSLDPSPSASISGRQ
jgi:hypothetical protein